MSGTTGEALYTWRPDEECGSGSGGGKKKRKRFVGVRQRPSGRWVAEIKDTTQKIRMWLGTFETAEDAARAYDEAARLLRGSNTRTNFVTATQTANSAALAARVNRLLSLRRATVTATAAEGSSPAPPPPPRTPKKQKPSTKTEAVEDVRPPVPAETTTVPTDEYRCIFSEPAPAPAEDGSWPFDFAGDLPPAFHAEFPLVDDVSVSASASRSGPGSAAGADCIWDLPPLWPLSCRT